MVCNPKITNGLNTISQLVGLLYYFTYFFALDGHSKQSALIFSQ